MQIKILLKRILFIIILSGFFIVLFFIVHFIFKNKNSLESLNQNTISLNEQGKVNPNLSASSVGRPIRLKIPSIEVDAVVSYVGLTSDGAMDVPKGPLDVAWYNLGPRPGEVGSAVIDGHSGWKNGIHAVFDDLYKLQKGDKIYVEDEKGIMTTFMVREFQSYDPSANALDVFSSNDGKAHLNLITCGGVWNEFSRSHSKRLVVFTDKE